MITFFTGSTILIGAGEDGQEEILFLLDGLRSLGQTLDFEPFRSLEEGGKLVLSNVDLSGVHELQDGSQMLK